MKPIMYTLQKTLLISYRKMCYYKLPDDGPAGLKQVKIKYGCHLYGSHLIVFIIKQTTLMQSDTQSMLRKLSTQNTGQITK
jgi:hypothetical protein